MGYTWIWKVFELAAWIVSPENRWHQNHYHRRNWISSFIMKKTHQLSKQTLAMHGCTKKGERVPTLPLSLFHAEWAYSVLLLRYLFSHSFKSSNVTHCAISCTVNIKTLFSIPFWQIILNLLVPHSNTWTHDSDAASETNTFFATFCSPFDTDSNTLKHCEVQGQKLVSNPKTWV